MNSYSPLLTGFINENSPPVVSQANPRALKPHPWNSAIYGEDEDVTSLIEMIRGSGWVKPLVITPTGTIISGHRRCKAVLALGWESVPVVEREFPNSLAELEALLLENASRLKTTEQKVREGEAWRELEASIAKIRQTANLKIGNQTPVRENFPTRERGRVSDMIASRVGLGSGRTYSIAAKVVEAIDSQTILGNLETAQALRSVLNSRSVDAAAQLLKRISLSSDHSIAAAVQDSPTTCNSCKGTDSSDFQSSCWNCQHRGELIENHSFYCNRMGVLSLIDKSADARGSECDLWSQEADQTVADNFTQPNYSTFTLTLPAHLQPLLQDVARAKGMSVVDWATVLLESEAKRHLY